MRMDGWEASKPRTAYGAERARDAAVGGERFGRRGTEDAAVLRVRGTFGATDSEAAAPPSKAVASARRSGRGELRRRTRLGPCGESGSYSPQKVR